MKTQHLGDFLRPVCSTAFAALAIATALLGSAAPASAFPAGPAASSSQEAKRAVADYNLGSDTLAIQGYDPVAYFEIGGGAPRKGSASISLNHQGATYRFATEENRATFVASPETYEPAHGGWCSFAMAKNIKYKIDPAAYRIGEGRLLLFADKEYAEFDGDWVPKERSSLEKADKNWKTMTGESARKASADTWRAIDNYNLSKNDLAIEGYDPVSYFKEGGSKPKEGKSKYSLRHGGVLYYFASEKNRTTFLSNPERFEPQHGGWCSYALGARNKKVEVDPEAYRMTNGQLHLFFNAWYDDTRDGWDEDTANLKRKADANFASLLKKSQAKY